MSIENTAQRPLRLVQVGAGGMGRAWLRNVAASPGAEIVGLADLYLDTAKSSAAECGYPDIAVATSLGELLARLDGDPAGPVDGVVNVTIPDAHLPVNIEAVSAGLPVICEKPAAPTVAEALQMVAVAQASGQLIMISQSRRHYAELAAFRERVAELGPLGMLTAQFFKAVHFGGFREEMRHPLLVDMSIHHFDQARYLTGANPVRVSATSHNPSWSWFSGDASATVDVELDSGAHLAYAGSWVAGGQETSWNADWRVSGEHGTACWDGESSDPTDREIAGSLAEFVAAVRGGPEPETKVARNIWSLIMVEAAVTSADTGRPVVVADALEAAYEQAIESASTPEIAEVLKSWSSVHEGLSR